jgi:hypothetical protein
MELANNVVESKQTDSFIQIFKKIFSENKMYIYIGIAVVVLAIVLYYFYSKNKKETKPIAQAQQNAQPDTQPNAQSNQEQVTVPQISGDDYWVLDAQGNPVKVSGMMHGMMQQPGPNKLAPLPIPKQTPSMAEIQMLQKQMLDQQMMQQQILQQQMEQHQANQAIQANQANKKIQKIHHPIDPADSENMEIQANSDDINVELARIKANEDDNVAQHDLTNSELAEITEKLKSMGSKLNGNF